MAAAAARPRASNDPAVVWQLAWALAALACAGVVLIAVGKASLLAMLAMLTIGLPGLIGALWRPQAMEKAFYLGLWGLAAAMAATLEGGLGGPLAVWCVMPAVATIVVEAPWICGVGLSVGALLVITAINALHLAWPVPHHPLNFWLSFVAVLSTSGGAVGGLAVARRRSKAARAAVEAELAGFQTLMGELPELALAMDLDGRAEAVFGRPLPGLDAATLHEGLLHAAQEEDRPKLRAAMDEAADHGHAVTVFTPDTPGAMKISAALQRTAAGGLTAILREAPVTPARLPTPEPVAIPAPTPIVAGFDQMADLNRRLRAAETGRERAEADAAGRARFLANMSHELRTPLNAIMGFSDIMRSKMFGEMPPKYAEYAELIHESGRHLMDLINDVLDVSKIEAHRYELAREAFDVREAVNAALRLVRLQADEAGIRLRGVLPTEPLEVDADRRAIKQMVLNLVSNALKFTPAGGAVTVSADRVAGAFDLTVSDTGMGIAPEDLKRLGRPYEQAGGAADRAQGTGLGLSLVRSLAELHGGGMNIESRLGEGTAVTVRMPVLVAAAAEEVIPQPETAIVPPEPGTGQVAEPSAALDAKPVQASPLKVAPGGAPEPDL